jgi:hypothetical protein
MTGTNKIVVKAFALVGIVLSILIGSCAFRIKQYRTGFSQVEIGQSIETVINLMGKPSEIRQCSFPVNNRNKNIIAECSELIAFQGISEQWALAIDKSGNVIEKYYWFFGEYGNRPPDTN